MHPFAVQRAVPARGKLGQDGRREWHRRTSASAAGYALRDELACVVGASVRQVVLSRDGHVDRCAAPIKGRC